VLAGEKEVQLDYPNEDFEFDRDGTCSMLLGKIDDKLLELPLPRSGGKQYTKENPHELSLASNYKKETLSESED